MTPKQKTLYWREWAAVRQAKPDADRHTLHAEALGRDKSSNAFDNADLDKVLGVFRAISRPADVNAQIRQLNQPRIRSMHRLQELTTELGVHFGNQFRAESYVVVICQNKFHQNFFTELSDRELQQLVMTVENRLRKLRVRQQPDPATAGPLAHPQPA
jgi:hypothetical protein